MHRNRPNPHGTTRRRKIYHGAGRYLRTEGTPAWRPLAPRHRCRLYETALYLKGNLPKPMGSQGAITATVVLVFHALLFEFASGTSGACLPAIPTIAQRTGCSESSVERALIVLRAIGLVTPHPRHMVYAISRGFDPKRRRNRGTEIWVETSYAFTFPTEAALDDLTRHLGRMLRRLADLGCRRGVSLTP